MADETRVDRPYPGLRPFEAWEGEIFFGREAHTDRLLEILRDRHFLAVIGPSGSGKSSLVRAGLLPALPLGAIGTGSDWRIALLRPGNRPIRSLAKALLAPEVLGAELPGLTPALLEAELRADAGSLARLAEGVRQRDPEADFNLLVVVDQFEELFTYAEAGSEQSDESEAFVTLLIRSTADLTQRVFACLTMRTDFLGQCVRFLDLPEAINHGQYLTPRMSRDQLHEAIRGPARLFGGDVDEGLIEELINGVDGNPDQLPVLQHALARMWSAASRRDPGRPLIGRTDHDAIGGVGRALAQHADQVFAQLDEPARAAAECMLRAVTATRDPRAPAAQIVRRPCSLRKIAQWSGLPPERFVPVLAAFTDEDVCFLVASGPQDDPETIIDISHEALIRQWSRLSAWTLNEAQRAIGFLRLGERAMDYGNGNQSLLRRVELDRAEAWRHGGHAADAAWCPTPAWAARYWDPKSGLPDLAGILAFIDRSREEVAAEARREEAARLLQVEAEQARLRAELALKGERRAEADAARQRRLARGLMSAVLVGLLLASWAVWQTFEARALARQEREAVELATIRRLAAEGPAVVDGVLPGGVTLGMLEMLAAHRLAAREASRSAAPVALGALERAFVRSRRLERLIESSEAVTALALSPDGQRIASGSREGALQVRRALDGALLATASERAGYVNGVAFSPDGRWLVSANRDATLRRWEAASGQPVGAPMRGHQGQVGCVAVSPDGRHIVSGGWDGSLRFWNAATGEEVAPMRARHAGAVYAIAFSPDGRLVASASDDKTVGLWDAATGAAAGVLRGHATQVYALAFSPDGRRIVSGDEAGALILWDVGARSAVGRPVAGHEGSALGLAFSPDGALIVSVGEDKALRLWRAADVAPLGEPLAGHWDWITGVAFSPDGGHLISGSYDHTLRIWRVADEAPLAGHQGAVRGVAISPDGRRIVSGSADGTLRLWDARAGVPLGSPPTGGAQGLTSVAFSPGGERIAAGSEDGKLRLWDARTGTPLGPPLAGHTQGVTSVAFSPDGRRLASGSDDNTLRLWDAVTGKPVGAALGGHGDIVTSVAFSPDGRLLVSGSYDTTLRLWDAAGGRPVGEPFGPSGDARRIVTSVAFSPDGKSIVSAGDDWQLHLWNAATRRPLGKPLVGHTNRVRSAAFSPDGGYLVSGSDDGSLRLWSVATGTAVGDPLLGHAEAVRSVAFSPDGRFVVSGSDDRTLRRWPVLEAWADALCAKLQRNMSHDEWRARVSPDIPYITQCDGLPVPAEPADPGKETR